MDKISEEKIVKLGTKYRKEVKEIMDQNKMRFVKRIDDSTYVFDRSINNYLNRVLQKIYASNPDVDHKNFYFFFQITPLPNAVSYGNGIFTVNLGLFNYINSDDELAYILCHELSHYQLNHFDNSVLRNIEFSNAKQTKQKIREVKRTEYGKRKIYSQWVEETTYNFLKHSRAHEVQADSLGLVMFKKTDYKIAASISSLKQLKLSDSIFFNEDSKIKQHFNFENYPFKDAWLVKDETLFNIKKSVNDFEFNQDSLKTHPEMSARIDFLKKMIGDAQNQFVHASPELDQIKHLTSLMLIQNAIDTKSIDFALYQTMILYNRGEITQKTFCTITARLLQMVYELKTNHQFGKYVGLISPFSDERSFNQVRQFLHNIELKNIKKIGFNFCSKYESIMEDDPNFKQSAIFFNQLNQN